MERNNAIIDMYNESVFKTNELGDYLMFAEIVCNAYKSLGLVPPSDEEMRETILHIEDFS